MGQMVPNEKWLRRISDFLLVRHFDPLVQILTANVPIGSRVPQSPAPQRRRLCVFDRGAARLPERLQPCPCTAFCPPDR